MSVDQEVLSSLQGPAPVSQEYPGLADQRTEFRSFKDSAFSEGWYMLEVSGALQTIGANVTLRGLVPGIDEEIWSDLAHVQLGSHSETKRLVRIASDVEEISVLIDGEVEFRSAPGIVLVRVTESFASDRMVRKIRYASTIARDVLELSSEKEVVPDNEILPLYRAYQELMERHIRPVTYGAWLAKHDDFSTDLETAADQTIVKEAVETDEFGYEVTVDISRAGVQGLAAESVGAGKATGLMGNPSLSIVITHLPDSVSHIENIHRALNCLLETIQCELTVVVPNTLTDLRLHELTVAFPTIVEIAYFDPTADCSSLDAFFGEHLSDLQVFLCGDVLLDVSCLLRLYTAIRANPGVAMIYSDNDCVDEFGRRINPVFKPEWNPELLMNGNYIGSVVMMARHVVTATGGWQHRFEDSALYDLLLRAGDYLVPAAVMRIADVLWHARIMDSAESVFLARGRRDPQVLQDYLDGVYPVEREISKVPRATHDIRVRTGLLTNTLKIDREFQGVLPQVEILIPSKDKVDLLESCINSILKKTGYVAYSITIIDNGSEEVGTLEYYAELERHPVIKLLHYPGEFNYSALNNFAANQSSADVLLLLNNDIEVISGDWLHEMVSQTMQPNVGCVGAKLYYSNNRVQHGGVVVGLKGMAGHAHRFLPRDSDGYCGRLKMSQNVSAVTAACLAVRREIYQQVRGLDEINLKVAYNDVDFCLRVLEAGYRNVWTPYAELYHHESVSRGADDTPPKQRRFREEFEYMRRRWATDSWEDPAYNPNLAKDVEDFSLSA